MPLARRLVIFGAGTGMADQISAAMVRTGASRQQATSQVWLIDKNGLVTDDMHGLPDYQQAYARPAAEVRDWHRIDGNIDLLEVVKRVEPTILIGTSTAHGAFTQQVVEALCAGVERPILLPLSNTHRGHARPGDPLVEGQGPDGCGHPGAPVEYDGTTYTIGQANNALLYPGLGLGTIVSGAEHVTDAMLLAAADAVAGQVDVSELGASLAAAGAEPARLLGHGRRRRRLGGC